MQSKRLIHEKDYDSYLLDYPRKEMHPFFAYKNREKYVLGELEKLHPCFEGRCKADVHHVTQNGKGKIWALVIDAGRLTKYQGISGRRKLYVSIWGKSKKPHYKRVFRQNYFLHHRTKIFVVTVASVFVGLAVFLWSGNILKNQHTTLASDINLLNEQDSHFRDLTNIGGIDASLVLSSQAFMDSLDESLKKGAICASFDYNQDRISQNSDALQTRVLASLSGLYPEQIYSLFYMQSGIEVQSNAENSIEISGAVFENSIPSLDVSYFGSGQTASVSADSLYGVKNDGYVRGLVVEHKGSVQTEDFTSRSISFTIATLDWNDFFTALSNLLMQNNLTFKKLSLSCAPNENTVLAQFALEVGDMPSELNKLSMLFNAQSERQKNIARDRSKLRAIPIVKTTAKVQPAKLGTVQKPDGSVISFYAGADGKMIFSEDQ